MRSVTLLLAAAVICSVAPVAKGHDLQFKESSDQFVDGSDNSLKELEEAGLLEDLVSRGLAAKSTVNDIKPLRKLPVSGGESGTIYDVILQPGHYGRTKNSTGSQGALVSEQEIAAYIVELAAAELKARDINALILHADDFRRDKSQTSQFEGLRAYIFLAVHADGSVNECKSAPSLGYDANSDLLGMHAIAFGLATSLGYSYKDFMRDGFTSNLTNYYAFKHIKTRGYGGVLEIGELTCPEEEKLLVESASLIGKNLGVSIASTLEIIKNKEKN